MMFVQPQRPSWAPERFRLRGVEYTFELVAPATGDAIYGGTRKGIKVHALRVKP